jgi:hypothetical protein
MKEKSLDSFVGHNARNNRNTSIDVCMTQTQYFFCAFQRPQDGSVTGFSNRVPICKCDGLGLLSGNHMLET